MIIVIKFLNRKKEGKVRIKEMNSIKQKQLYPCLIIHVSPGTCTFIVSQTSFINKSQFSVILREGIRTCKQIIYSVKSIIIMLYKNMIHARIVKGKCETRCTSTIVRYKWAEKRAKVKLTH